MYDRASKRGRARSDPLSRLLPPERSGGSKDISGKKDSRGFFNDGFVVEVASSTTASAISRDSELRSFSGGDLEAVVRRSAIISAGESTGSCCKNALSGLFRSARLRGY